MTGPLLTLTQAAALIPGATVDTLKRRARAGLLTVYRPGKSYLTTEADLQGMILACRVAQKDRACGSARPVPTSDANQTGLSSTELSSAALDAALATLQGPKRRLQHT